jgi:hypothetical protein
MYFPHEKFIWKKGSNEIEQTAPSLMPFIEGEV